MYRVGIFSNTKERFVDLNTSLSFFSLVLNGFQQPNDNTFHYDVIILDIDGVEEEIWSEHSRQINHHNIPFILISSKLSSLELDNLKPILVYSHVDIISLRYVLRRIFTVEGDENSEELLKDSLTDGLFLKDGSKYIRLQYDHLLFLQADGNYVVVQMKDRKYIVRFSLRKSSGVLHSHSFLQVHRNYIINFRKIEEVDIENNTVTIGEHIIPIGRAYKSKLKESLPALQ